jgi:antitoxin HigA-1
MNRLDAVTPGELLLEEFLKPMGISQYRLAKEIDVPAQRIGQIVKGRRAITADTDLRLCRFFGLSDGYWLRAQVAHDTELTRDQTRAGSGSDPALAQAPCELIARSNRQTQDRQVIE